MENRFDEVTVDIIKERLIFTKLSNTFEVHKFNNEYYVLIQGIIAPYRIFMLGLLKYGLWTIRFSKTDWFLINRDLMEIWTELNIVPSGVVFDVEKKDFKNAPIKWFKAALTSLTFDQKILEYFSVRFGEDLDIYAQYEAMLYFAEEQYESLSS